MDVLDVRGQRQRRLATSTMTAAVAALTSSFLLHGGFPPNDLSVVVWIALAPLLMALRAARPLQGFFLAWLTGAVFYGLHNHWLLAISTVPATAYLATILYAGAYFGLFGAVFVVLRRRTGLSAVLVAPLLWATIEYARSNASFLSLPFGLLGFSQYRNAAILQLASLTSVYGLSCLIVLVNAALAEVGIWALTRHAARRADKLRRLALQLRIKGGCIFGNLQPSYRGSMTSLAVALSSVLLVWLWGRGVVSQRSSSPPSLLTAALIQGNIPQDEKWDRRFRDKILQRYRDLTLQAARDRPDLIIWPEAATPGYVNADANTRRDVQDLARQTGIPLLFGSASFSKIGRDERRQHQYRNSVFLMDRLGETVATYHKMRLLPFGEYLPLKGRFPWPRWLVPSSGRFIAGTTPTVFELPKGRFGVAICWENLFPDFVRSVVNTGAQFIVNPTNEAWFGPAASQQFLATAALRAAEHRVSLLRVANTGITSYIDPLGRIKARVQDDLGNDVNVTGSLAVAVSAPMGTTYYTRHGDVFAKTSAGLTVLFLLAAFMPMRVRQLYPTCKPQVRYERDEN